MKGYNIINMKDFDALGVPQAVYNVTLDNIGDTQVVVYQVNGGYGIIFNNNAMFPNTNGVNPWQTNDTAAYIDENNDLWVGIDDN